MRAMVIFQELTGELVQPFWRRLGARFGGAFYDPARCICQCSVERGGDEKLVQTLGTPTIGAKIVAPHIWPIRTEASGPPSEQITDQNGCGQYPNPSGGRRPGIAVARYSECEGRYDRKGKVRLPNYAENRLSRYVICPVATRLVFGDGGNQNRRDGSRKGSDYHCSYS